MKLIKIFFPILLIFCISNVQAQKTYDNPKWEMDIKVYDINKMLNNYQIKNKFKVYASDYIINKNADKKTITSLNINIENTSCFDVDYKFKIRFSITYFYEITKEYKGTLKAGKSRVERFKRTGDHSNIKLKIFSDDRPVAEYGVKSNDFKRWQKNTKTLKCLGFKSIEDFNQKVQNKRDREDVERKKKEKQRIITLNKQLIANQKKWVKKWQNRPNELYQYYIKNITKQGVFVNTDIDSLAMFSKTANKPILIFGEGSISQLKSVLKKASQNTRIQNQEYITSVQYNNQKLWKWINNNLANFTGLPAIILVKIDGSAGFLKFNPMTESFDEAMKMVNTALKSESKITKTNTVKKKDKNPLNTEKNTITTKWKNGNIKAVFEQQNGQKTGSYTRYFEYYKGVIAEKGMYSKDKPVGKWEAYYTNGNVKRITEFAYKNNDKIVNSKSYYFSGKLKAKYQTVNGNFDGTQTNYNENGKIVRIRVFKNGEKIKDVKQ